MKSTNKLKLAVLYGGFSSERQISLKTGKAVYATLLENKKYKVTLIDLKKNNYIKKLLELKKDKVGLIFNALHGKFGEDGKLQSLLDILGLKYTGANALSSAIAMNKVLTKGLLLKNKILTPKYWVLNDEKNALNLIKKYNITFPLVVKPVSEGSAIGVSVIKSNNELNEALKLAFKYNSSVLVEKYISGRELSVPILGNEVLPIIEIKPNYNMFYDYESKYKNGGSIHTIPARLNKNLYHKISNIAIKSMKVIGCEVMCRVDIIVDENNEPYVLEINTIPGMTETSLFPEAAKEYGIEFPCLLDKIIDLSIKKYCV